MSTTTMVIKGKYTILSGGKVAVVVVKRCPPCIYSLDILDIAYWERQGNAAAL